MRPYHAGLFGADSLAVLHEAHLIPPFKGYHASGRRGCGLRSLVSRCRVYSEIRLGQDSERLGRRQDALKPVAPPEQAADSLLALALEFLDLPEESLLEATGSVGNYLHGLSLSRLTSRRNLVDFLLLTLFSTIRG
jgi:hypothetical protein